MKGLIIQGLTLENGQAQRGHHLEATEIQTIFPWGGFNPPFPVFQLEKPQPWFYQCRVTLKSSLYLSRGTPEELALPGAWSVALGRGISMPQQLILAFLCHGMLILAWQGLGTAGCVAAGAGSRLSIPLGGFWSCCLCCSVNVREESVSTRRPSEGEPDEK